MTRSDQRAAAGGTAVQHIDERNAGETEFVAERVGVAGRVTATVGELDVPPPQVRVRECTPRRDRALLQAVQAGRSTERVDANADDSDAHGFEPQARRKA